MVEVKLVPRPSLAFWPGTRPESHFASEVAMLGFAIVGCGMIARFHARALADVPGTRVTALVGRSAGSATKMRDELGLRCDITTDLGEILKRKEVDVVIITTPSGAH